MELPESFYDVFIENLPEDMIRIYDSINARNSVQKSFKEFVIANIGSLIATAPSLSVDYLKEAVSKKINTKKTTKTRLKASFLDTMKIEYTNADSAFYRQYERLRNSTSKEYYNSYGSKPIEEVMKEYISHVTSLFESWAKDRNVDLCLFPLFDELSFKEQTRLLSIDLCYNFNSFISENDIIMENIYSHPFPTSMVNYPIFSIGSFSIDLEDINGTFTRNLLLDSEESSDRNGAEVDVQEELNLTTTKNMSNTDSLGPLVHEVAEVLITMGFSTEREINSEGRVVLHCTKTGIANKLYPEYNKHFSQGQLDSISYRLELLVNNVYTVKKGQVKTVFHYIDTIHYINSNDMIIELGGTVSSAIKNKDVIQISRNVYKNISRYETRAFVPCLQDLRFKLQLCYGGMRDILLNRREFEKSVYFGSMHYTKRNKAIELILEDLKSANEIIKDCAFIKGRFWIRFYELTPDDLKYFHDWNKINTEVPDMDSYLAPDDFVVDTSK